MNNITVFDGNEGEITLNTHWVICYRCSGEGVHDCWEGGMTSEEMYEQGDDFLDDYLGGMYDKTCMVCNGKRVVAEVDEHNNSPELLELYHQQEQEMAELRAMERAEQRMGA